MDLKGLSLLIKRLNPKELLEAIDHVDNSVADFKVYSVLYSNFPAENTEALFFSVTYLHVRGR